MGQQRPQHGATEAAEEIGEAGEIRSGQRAHQQHHEVGEQQQRNHVQDLRRHGEALNPAVQEHAGVGENHVGQRVLAEQAAVGYVHHQPEQPGGEEAELARFMDAPVEHQQRDKIRRQPCRPADPGQQVGEQRQCHRQQDEAGAHRQQQFLRCHRVPAHPDFFRFFCGDVSLSEGRSAFAGIGPSTNTWAWLCTPASGLQLMLAKR